MPDLRWYIHRLGRMGPQETGHRVIRLLTTELEKRGVGLASPPPDPVDQVPESLLPDLDINTNFSMETISAAERTLSGRYELFGLGEVLVGADYGWNRDPRTGVEATLKFGKSIDYRNERLVGDIKFLWEPNRHLQLIPLAQAFYLTKEEKYLREIIRQIDSWITQCPYPRGPNWASALELGIRLINWSWIWRLCADALRRPLASGPYADFTDRWLGSIYQHLFFVTRYYSRFSSANNHLIGEAAGVYIAVCTWPFWRQTNSWGVRAKQILIQECERQNTVDGVNREQAIAYQQFVLEFLLLAGLCGHAADDKFPEKYWDRIESMLDFLAALMDCRGRLPMIGDDDEGRVTKLDQGTKGPFCRSLLALGGELYGRQALTSKAGGVDDQTQWLLAGLGREKQVKLPVFNSTRNELPRFFPEGGYYVLADKQGTDQEIKAVVDIGPLGYESIAAHGHADALAFTLSVGGRDCLIDPGTYAYHTEKRWRDYFRGTAAHNTVRVDAEDQSVPGGNFMWIKHANAVCQAVEEGNDHILVRGRHDGYCRFSDPVTHERCVELLKGKNQIVVTDRLLCRGYHEAEIFWHFSEHCHITLKESQICAELAGAEVTLTVEGDAPEPELLVGSEDPLGGWVSRRFGVKEPAPTVVWRWRVRGDHILKTLIAVDQR